MPMNLAMRCQQLMFGTATAWLIVCGAIVLLSGCYGTVEPKWEDSLYPFSSPSEEELIHIPSGFTPAVAVAGLIQVAIQDRDEPTRLRVETRESGADLRNLLDSISGALSSKSGIHTETWEGKSRACFAVDTRGKPNQEYLPEQYEGLLSLSESLPVASEQDCPVSDGFTHLVLVHSFIEKSPIDAAPFIADGGVAPAIGLFTNRHFRFTVKANVYALESRLKVSSLQLSDEGDSAAVWTVLVYPAAVNAVSVNRFLDAIGNRLGEEIAKRWVVDDE